MKAFLTYVRLNWKTNMAAAVLIVYSAPAFITAVEAWSNHQPANWRDAIIGLIAAAGLAAAKDGDNHSTLAQVQAKQAVVEGKPNALMMVHAAQKQVVEAGK